MRKKSSEEIAADGRIEDAEGISKEDQADILRQIDQISQANRISNDPSMWKVKATKKGFLVPLAVNLSLYVLLAAGIFGFTQLFAANQASTQVQSIQLNTVEGQLLQEIRKEAEGQLLEKDREIRDIQARLASIAQEKELIAASIEERIQAREMELRTNLENELEAERQRLRAEGISEDIIQERLREFERQKTLDFNQQMAVFRTQMETEQRELEDSLEEARSEFSENLAAATRERQRIQDESRQREVELRSQIDQQNRELEAARAQAAANLQTAQAELQRLNDAASRAQAAEDRLLGLYTGIREAVREGRVNDAANGLQSLQSYINDPAIASLQALSKRRDIDLFAIDLIQRTIAAERAKESSESTRLTEALSTLTGIREAAARGRSAAEAGNQVAATAAYNEALSLVPELAAVQGFTDQALAASRQVAVSEDLVRIDAAWENSDWEALDQAFGDLLRLVPLTDPQVITAISRLKSAGADQGDVDRIAQESQSILVGLQTADASLAAGSFGAAIQQYANLLTVYPYANQRPQILASIRQAGIGLNNQLSQEQTRAQSTQTGQQESAQLIAQMDSEVARLNSRIAELETALQQASSAQGGQSSQDNQSATGTANNSAQLSALQIQLEQSQTNYRRLQAEAEAYAIVAAKFEGLLANYRSYAASDDRRSQDGSQAALVAAQNLLRTFFGSAEAAEAMPGIADRVGRVIDSYIAAASSIGTEIMFNAADIVDGILRAPDKDAYLAVQRTRFASNADLLAFIDEMDRIF